MQSNVKLKKKNFSHPVVLNTGPLELESSALSNFDFLGKNFEEMH